MTLRLGSLCSGYEGLGMGIAEVLDVELAWVADPDPGASAVLAHHWPDVANLGDITGTTWQDVERVDIMCAGFPCQDISYAGRGEGIQEGNRSGLWHVIADALGVLRPSLVVLENVAGIVARRPGLDVVLADLARLGFDASWRCVRASDVGAPHGRNRWFLVAQDANRTASGERWIPAPGQAPGGRPWADAGRRGRAPVADAYSASRRLDIPGGGPSPLQGSAVAQRASQQPRRLRGGGGDEGAVAWGQFEPAIRRWEHVTGRTAPDPTEPGQRGKPRLNPVFVEWMQGLAAGHVTAVPGLTRNQMLKALGNGVVPQQAAYASSLLLPALFAAMERKDVPA